MTLADTLEAMRRAPLIADPEVGKAVTAMREAFDNMDRLFKTLELATGIDLQDIDRNAPGYQPGISKEVMK